MTIPYDNPVPVRIDGLRVTMPEINVFGMNCPAADFQLPEKRMFGGKTAEVYLGIDLYSARLIPLPFIHHDGWIPVAYARATDVASYQLTPITPRLPITGIGEFHRLLRMGAAVNVLFLGSSLCAELFAVAKNLGGNDALTHTLGAYTLTQWGATATGVNGGYPGRGVWTHFAHMFGQTRFNLMGGTTLLYNQTSAFSYGNYSVLGSATHTSVTSSFRSLSNLLVVIEMQANIATNKALGWQGLLRRCVKEGIMCALTTSHFFTDTSVGTGWLGHDWVGPSERLQMIACARGLGIPVIDTAAFMLMGCLTYGMTAMYRDAYVHQSRINVMGGPTAPVATGGQEAWAKAIAGVAAPEMYLYQVQPYVHPLIDNPLTPWGADIFMDDAIKTLSGSPVRAKPRAAIPRQHMLNLYGETNTVQIPAGAAVAAAHPCPLTVMGAFQNVDDCYVEAYAGGLLKRTVHVVTQWHELLLATDFHTNPPNFTVGRGIKIVNKADSAGSCDLVALVAFTPEYRIRSWPLGTTVGTWTADDWLDGLKLWTNTNNDYIYFTTDCKSMITLHKEGKTSGAAKVDVYLNGALQTQLTAVASGGYTRNRYWRFDRRDLNDFYMVLTAAAGTESLALVQVIEILDR